MSWGRLIALTYWNSFDSLYFGVNLYCDYGGGLTLSIVFFSIIFKYLRERERAHVNAGEE